MSALRTIAGFVTAPSTTETALTMATGDSLTIINSPRPVWLVSAWCDAQTAGLFHLTAPRGTHDNNQGIRLQNFASEVYPLLSPPFTPMFLAQDTITAKLTGSGTAGDIETGVLQFFYEDLPGANARLIDYGKLMRCMEPGFLMTGENTLALGTAGGYSGEEALNADFDQFRGNRDYALLGINTNVECAMIGLRGPDTGYNRIGFPGNDTNKSLTRNFLVVLSRAIGRPTIPVINAANKAATLVDGVQDENGADPTVTWFFAMLKEGWEKL